MYLIFTLTSSQSPSSSHLIQFGAVLVYRKLHVIRQRRHNVIVETDLLLRVVEAANIRMAQGLVGCDALVRVKLQQLLTQVDGILRSITQEII